MVNPKLKRQPSTESTLREFTLTITKTIQEPKFEPSGVSLSETHVLDDGQDYAETRDKVRRQMSAAVEAALVKEVLRYRKNKNKED